MGPADASIRAVITADDRASSAIANFGRRADKTFQTTMRNARRLALLGFGAVIAGAVSSVKAFNESERATAQLNAVLKSTKSAAGVTSRAAIKLAEDMQQLTTFSDEEIMSAENLILTFTKINKKIFPDTIKIVADMSQALGQDLKSSSIQVGKALQDPILGITALRRVGVNFNAEQKETVKRLVETGQSAKAQALILKELQTEFGGSANAARNTFGGSMKVLKNNINDVQESIGQLLVAKLAPLVAKFSEWVKTHKPQITAAFQDIINKIIALGTFIVQNRKLIMFLIGAYIALKTAMFLSGALNAFLNVMAGVRGAALLTAKTFRGVIATVRLLQITIATPIAFAISIAAALAALYILRKEIGNTKAALQGLEASYAARPSLDKYLATYNAIKKKQGPAAAKRYAQSQNSTRASGGPVRAGQPYLVGEKGPELVVPQQSGKVIPNNKLSSGGGPNIHFNVNIGMFAGTPIERRKIAAILFRDFKDVAAKYGVTPSNLLDGANGAVIR